MCLKGFVTIAAVERAFVVYVVELFLSAVPALGRRRTGVYFKASFTDVEIVGVARYSDRYVAVEGEEAGVS